MLKPLFFGVTLALLGSEIFGTAQEGSAPAEKAYLFTYFTKNGEDGLHLAWSGDGYKWEALNGGQSYLAPTVGKGKLMRSPSAVLGADGVYHLVWASGMEENNIGHASTRDFIHWSAEQEIPVMASEPDVRNCWTPVLVFNAKWHQYFIIWTSAIKGKFSETDRAAGKEYNNRIYCTTTKDFVSFDPTRLFYDPGYPAGDAIVIPAEGRYYLVLKDDTSKPAKKNLRTTNSDSFDGPYGDPDDSFTPKRMWVERPTVVKIGGEYIVYFDSYVDNHYGAMSSPDLKSWNDVTSKMVFPGEDVPNRPDRMRGASVITVPAAIVDQLRSAAPAH